VVNLSIPGTLDKLREARACMTQAATTFRLEVDWWRDERNIAEIARCWCGYFCGWISSFFWKNGIYKAVIALLCVKNVECSLNGKH